MNQDKIKPTAETVGQVETHQSKRYLHLHFSTILSVRNVSYRASASWLSYRRGEL